MNASVGETVGIVKDMGYVAGNLFAFFFCILVAGVVVQFFVDGML